MKFYLILLLIVVWSPTSWALFFENSFRQTVDNDPNALAGKSAAAAVVEFFDQACAGFFVRNSQNKNFVATARHCFTKKYDKDPHKFCEADDNYLWDQWKKTIRRCKRVVFDAEDSEVVIFEVGGPPPTKTLVIHTTSYTEDPRRLQMYGFPLDPLKQPGMNVTQNCWLIEGVVDREEIVKDIREYSDLHNYHNCTTYAGNSGGPMVIEETDLVIGMPGAFREILKGEKPLMQKSRPNPETETRGLVLNFISFAQLNRDLIDEEGIIIDESKTQIRVNLDLAIPMAPGSYICQADEGNEYVVKPRYNSKNTLFDIVVWHKKQGDKDFGDYYNLLCEKESGRTSCKGLIGDEEVTFLIENTYRFLLIDSREKKRICQFQWLYTI